MCTCTAKEEGEGWTGDILGVVEVKQGVIHDDFSDLAPEEVGTR